MIALARFIMAGPGQAALVTVVSALLALLMPPLAWLSSAAVALVALQLGPQRGIQLIALASVASMALSWLVIGTPLMVFGLILLLWLPVWLVALVLRNSVSLSLALQVVVGLGVVFVLGMQLGFPQLEAELGKELSGVLEQMMQQQPEQVRQQQDAVLDMVVQMIPAILAAGVMLSTAIGLVLGRWWQSALYNPGAFNREFNQLRLGRVLAGVTTALLIGSLTLDVKMVTMMAVVLLTIYLIQGLALVHGIVDVKGWNRGWLFALYAGLFLLPQMVVLPLSVFGLTDAWIDFRRRLTGH